MKANFLFSSIKSKMKLLFIVIIIHLTSFVQIAVSQERDTNRLNIPIDVDILSLNKSNPNFYDIMRIMDKNNVGDTTEGSHYKQMKKAEIMWNDRLFPTGQTMQMGAAVTDYVKKFNSGQISSCNNQSWTEMGPIGRPLNSQGVGQIHAIKCSPKYTIDKVVYAASNWGGLWKKTGTADWVHLNTDLQLPFTSVSDIAIDPNNTDRIYITTGDAEMSMGHYASNLDGTPSQRTPLFTAGVYRSNNGGTTWHHINGGSAQPLLDDFVDGGTIRKILMHPDNSNILFIATSKGVYKCLNATATTPTWTKIFTPLNDIELKGLEFKPNTPNTIYVSGRDIYRSIDGGNTWSSITGSLLGLDLMNLPNNFIVNRINLAVNSNIVNDLYAYIVGTYLVTAPSTRAGRLYIYKFNGISWVLENSLSDAISLISPTRTPITTSPSYPNSLYYGFTDLRGRNESTQSIINLSPYLSNIEFHPDVHALAPMPGEQKMFVGTDGGVHIKDLTQRNLNGWTDISKGLGVKTPYRFDDSNDRIDRIMIGNQDTGTDIYINVSTDPNTPDYKWRRLAPNDGYNGKIDDKTGLAFGRQNSNQFSYDWNSNYFTKPEDNSSQTPIDPTENQPSGMRGTFQMKNHPITEKMIFSRTELYERKVHTQATSSDNAATLWDIRSDIGKDMNFTMYDDQWQRQLTEFDISSSNPNYWLIGLSGSQNDTPVGIPIGLTNEPFIVAPKLLRSTIGGCAGLVGFQTTTCFTDITQNLISSGVSNSSYQAVNGGPSTIIPVITSVIFHPENHLKAWVTFTGYEPTAKVWYTNDGGNNWYNTDLNGTLNNLPVNDIVYQKGTNDRLYIGTDAGIYYSDNSTNGWIKFCNFPNVMVTELKINYCVGKLRACTFGRGVWEGELLPSNGNIGSDALEITSNVTWNTSRGIDRNIRVKPGGTLNITGVNTVISMPKDGKIIIEQGGCVNVTDARLTNNCGKTWGSIEIWGNSNLSQSYANQGVLILNNATIEHAVEAVIVSKDGGTQFNGGIIQATNTKFLNNKRSVSFYKYEFQNNSSFFTTCNFKTDNNYRHSQSLLAHMTMWAVKNIQIRGCNFETTNNYAWDASRVHGIGTADAAFTVTDYCAGGIYPCPGAIKSTFKGLHKAINAARTTGTSTFNVYKSIFQDNVYGIITTGHNNFNIRANSFTVGKSSIINTVIHEGISIFAGTGFNVDQNTFTPTFTSNNSQPKTIGIRCTDTGASNKEIYKNTFSKLSTSNTNVFCANVSNGQNRNTQTGNADGLKYYCNFNNNNTMNGYDFAVQDLSPYLNLGVSAAQGSGTFPARNTFSLGTLTPSSDFNNGAATGFINYYHRVGVANEIPVNKFQVNNFTTSILGNSCSNRYVEGGIEALTRPDENNYNGLVLSIEETNRKLEQSKINGDKSEIEILEQDLLDLNRNKYNFEKEIIQYYINIDENQKLIEWYDRINDLTSKMALLDLYISKGDIFKAESKVLILLDDISKMADREDQILNYINLKTLQINALKENRDILFSNTENERSFLKQLANNDRGLAGYQSRNILNFLGDQYFIDPVLPDNNEWRSVQKFEKDLVNTSLKAYPNPASNLVNYSYDLGDINPEGTQLEIMDFMGRIIQELTIVLPNSNITWDCTFVPTGVYYYRIVKNKEEIIKPKSVIVIK